MNRGGLGGPVKLLVLIGAALLGVAIGLHAFSTPELPPEVGTVPDAAAVAATKRASASPGHPAVTVRPGLSGRQSARPAGQTVAVPAGKVAPVALTLTGRGTAPVIPEGVTKGALDLPGSVSTLGWWTGGVGLEAASGSVVIAGHVDSAVQGRGYFAVLQDVSPGTPVTVQGSDGVQRRYVVTGRRNYRKADGLPASVFDQSVQSRLVLITCTGSFNQATRSYEDNLVVYAVPAS